MRRRLALDESLILRLGAGVIGLVLLAAGSLAASLAGEHMIQLGTICGGGAQPHCGWCYAAVGLGLAGLAAFALAARRPPMEAATCPSSASRP